ncbi:MAG: hypothetical protein IKQ16_05295 [Lentisphaeria bacterium]|nr:hypothetical protein [Lentisphaeria bacterium]
MHTIQKISPKLRRITFAALLISASIFSMNTILAQETREIGRTIASPSGMASSYLDTLDSSSDEQTIIDPATGETGHIIRNPFGVANPDGFDTGMDVSEGNDDFLIDLPGEGEHDADDTVDQYSNLEEGNGTPDDRTGFASASAETATGKVLPVIDNPIPQRELTIEIALTGSTGNNESVTSTTPDIGYAPILHVATGGSFTLTVASTDNQTLDLNNIYFFFDGGNQNVLPGSIVSRQYLSNMSTSTSRTYQFSVNSRAYSVSHNVTVLYRYGNVTIVRCIIVRIRAFSILMDSNNDGVIDFRDETGKTNGNGKWIHINNLDVDNDGIPDFADGYDCTHGGTSQNSASMRFTPIIVRVSRHLDVSKCSLFFSFNEDSYSISRIGFGSPTFPYTYEPTDNGTIRIWTRDGDTARLKNPITDSIPGNRIPSQSQIGIPLCLLDENPDVDYSDYTLYIEAINPCFSVSGETIEAGFRYADAYTGPVVLSDRVKIIPYQIVFEGITEQKDASNILFNPCGIEKNKKAKFHFETLPASLPCSHITWSSSGVEFVGGNTGNNVTVKATGNADSNYVLTIDIGRNDYNPKITGKILDHSTVNLYIWILADNDSGENPAFSESTITNWLTKVNKIYKQVAMEYQIQDINYIKANDPDNNRDFRIIYHDEKNDELDNTEQLTSYPSDTNYPRTKPGLEIFFVYKLVGARGLTLFGNKEAGIIIPAESESGNSNSVSHGSYITWAHELGHACGLDDIYDQRNNGSTGDSEIQEYFNPNSLWIKNDCTYLLHTLNVGTVTGYYNYRRKHVDLLQRLLMFGYGSDTNNSRCDIPLGKVFGINTQGGAEEIKTGLLQMGNRHPAHTP